MSEEDLELLITLDDPGEPQEEYTFNHLQVENTLEFWLGQRFSAWCRLNGCVIEQSNKNFDIARFGFLMNYFSSRFQDR